MTMQASFFPRPRPRWAIRRSAFTFDNFVLAALPLGLTVSFNLVGQLLLSDLLVVVFFFVLLGKGRITLRQPYLRPLLLLLGLWFAAAIISDIVNASSTDKLLRGWVKILLFGLYLTVIFTLVNGSRAKLAIALVAFGLSQVLKTDLTEVELAGDLTAENTFRTAWKFGIGFGTSIILCALVFFQTGKRRLSSLVLLLYSPIHLILGARSMFLATFLAALLSHFSKPIISARARRQAVFAFVVLLVGGLVVGGVAYDRMTRAGVFGEIAREKHIVQTEGGTNFLLGGRAESLISFIAIRDKPIFGHGSWAENHGYRMMYLRLKELRGQTVRWEAGYSTRNSLIPSHSMLFGAMVEHGMFAAPFWLFVLSLALRAIPAGVLGHRPAVGFELMAVLLLIWDAFFSPFGAARRCYEAIFICTASLLLLQNKPAKPQRLINPI
ncbi:MAG: hypothetical protein JXQ91_09585 [Vannielia sp.]|uniref:hypothetical protein n=1 Tax=Vannielia sp. TaxID=2813045 RepID=UPI003B8B1F06